MTELFSFLISKYNYWGYIILMMVGLYAMIVKKNLVKKIIGMGILQTAIIFFYVSVAVKTNATIPTVWHSSDGGADVVRAADYLNPLPHVLMLTAIVVAVATLGVALALAIKIYRNYDTLEEDEIHNVLNRRAH